MVNTTVNNLLISRYLQEEGRYDKRKGKKAGLINHEGIDNARKWEKWEEKLQARIIFAMNIQTILGPIYG